MKKTWTTPELVTYGNVETITQQTGKTVPKHFGGGDDLGTQIS